MSNVLVSVLIPCYNSEKYLADTLDSVLAQTYPNIEIIVVDDGSTDKSLDIIDKYVGERGLKIYKQENRGACAARNHALLQSKGKYIQYLDADDLLSADKIASQMELVKKWGADYLYSCRWDRFERDLAEAYFPFRVLDKNFDDPLDWFLTAFSQKEMVASSSWLLSRKLANMAGSWNEQLTLSQDGEYFTRVITEAKGIRFDSQGKVYYRSKLEYSVSSKYRTEAGMQSNFLAVSSIESTLRSKYGNRPDLNVLLANRYQAVIYQIYPRNKELVNKANEKIRALGGHQLEPPFTGKTKILSSIIGWKATSYLKYLLLKKD